MSHGEEFQQQHDDDFGFWRDEPTSRLDRITERLPQIRGRFQRSSKEWEFGWDDEREQAPEPQRPTRPAARPVPPAVDRLAARRDVTSPTTRLRRPDATPSKGVSRPATRVANPAAFVDPLLRARAAAPRVEAPAPEIPVESPERVPAPRRSAGSAGAGVAGLLQQVDPTVRRVAALVAAVALLVPVISSLGSGDDGTASVAPENSTLATGTPVANVDDTPSTLMEIGATVPPAPQQGGSDAPAPSQEAPSVSATTLAPATTLAATENATPGRLESTEQSCSKTYEVVAGDYWILIAKKVSVSVNDVLAANKATVATAIFPGTTICLPANASAPTTTPATTPPTAAPTTAAPVTTVKPTPTTAPPTTVKPAPSTSVVPVKSSYTRAEVEAIIRHTWPDHLEEEALRIARRESNLIPTAKNFCCYGLFQIYFEVHKGWLAQLGVTSAQQLLDPHINAYVAVALYNRAGGWGPWKL